MTLINYGTLKCPSCGTIARYIEGTSKSGNRKYKYSHRKCDKCDIEFILKELRTIAQ